MENKFCFSSRRRHTRLTCDWSSDVCSSDLCQRDLEPDPDRGVVDQVDQPLRGELDEPRRDAQRVLAQARILVLGDRKSTRLNSSHMSISYAVFCLKKKKRASR